MLHTRSESNITFLRSSALESIPGVVHAFSTRWDGPHVRDDFLTAIGMASWPRFPLRQVHSNIVHWVGDETIPETEVEGDAAATPLRGMALGVATADCVPILIADRQGRAVGAAHAGWRGTAARVVQRTVESLVSEHGVESGDLAAAIGPHIGVCCMEVGEEVAGGFVEPAIVRRRRDWAKPHLDLGEANRRQLIEFGIEEASVQVSTMCTRCRADLFHSYRRDGASAGRMFSVIGIRP